MKFSWFLFCVLNHIVASQFYDVDLLDVLSEWTTPIATDQLQTTSITTEASTTTPTTCDLLSLSCNILLSELTLNSTCLKTKYYLSMSDVYVYITSNSRLGRYVVRSNLKKTLVDPW